jgi:hypothetical protein
MDRVDLDEFGRARFLRYSPNSAEFLDWGDFSFSGWSPEGAIHRRVRTHGVVFTRALE